MGLRGAGWLTAVVLAGLMAYGCITLLNMNNKVAEATRTQTQLQAQVDEMQESNAALRYALEHREDPDIIEDIAREKLGLVMPDDMIFYDSGE